MWRYRIAGWSWGRLEGGRAGQRNQLTRSWVPSSNVRRPSAGAVVAAMGGRAARPPAAGIALPCRAEPLGNDRDDAGQTVPLPGFTAAGCVPGTGAGLARPLLNWRSCCRRACGTRRCVVLGCVSRSARRGIQARESGAQQASGVVHRGHVRLPQLRFGRAAPNTAALRHRFRRPENGRPAAPESRRAPRSRARAACEDGLRRAAKIASSGVASRIRTGVSRVHSPVLCPLSYSHHWI